MSWFRLHTALLHNAKAQSLSGELFKSWINLLCLAKEGDGLIPSETQIAFHLRLKVSKALDVMRELEVKGFVIRNSDGTFKPHDWDQHQYRSDVSTERVKRFREQKRNVSETPPEYRVQSTESEQSQRQIVPSPKNGSGPAHGSRFDLAELPLEWQEWTARDLQWAAERAERTFATFGDYWRAKPGAAGRKADWLATWRNWCRREDGEPRLNANGTAMIPMFPRKQTGAEQMMELAKKRISEGRSPL